MGFPITCTNVVLHLLSVIKGKTFFPKVTFSLNETRLTVFFNDISLLMVTVFFFLSFLQI